MLMLIGNYFSLIYKNTSNCSIRLSVVRMKSLNPNNEPTKNK